MGRLLPIACLAATPLFAELSFSVVQNSLETPAGTQAVELGSAAPGDTLDTLFRVRNTGNATTALTMLTIAGSGFSLANPPSLPVSLLPGEYRDFTVRFQPAAVASYSALLRADGVSVIVLAKGLAALTLLLQEGGDRRRLNTGTPVDFGAVERGTEAVRHLVLENQTAQTLAATLSVVGDAFRLAAGTAAEAALDPQAAAFVDLVFAPKLAGPQQGMLLVNQRGFTLLGTTVEPPLPKPLITVDLGGQAPASAMQPAVAVHFDPPPRTSGAGKLRMEFHPSVTAPDDEAICLLATGTRTIGFSVIEGEADAQFGAVTAIPFQTGTTAGTIVFTAELGDFAERAALEIPAQPVAIDTVRLTRAAAAVEVEVSGYDNTRTLAQASFTFVRGDGTVIPPGAMQQDVAAAFSNYFASSTLGGVFRMKASFPVTGDASLVDSVKVVLDNSAGQTNWPQ